MDNILKQIKGFMLNFAFPSIIMQNLKMCD